MKKKMKIDINAHLEFNKIKRGIQTQTFGKVLSTGLVSYSCL